MATLVHRLYDLDKSIFGTEPNYPWIAILSLAVIAWVFSWYRKPTSEFPVVNDDIWTSFGSKNEYVKHAKQLLAEGHRKFSGPFTLKADYGDFLVLPPDSIDDVNAQPGLSLKDFLELENLAYYEPFRTFRSGPEGLFNEALLKGLTQSLPKFTKHLSLQMAHDLENTWTASTEWHEVDPKKGILTLVARLSSRIFLGPEWTENPEWIRISIEFTTNLFIAMAICKFCPSPIRWLCVQWLPLCRKLRRDYQKCAKLLGPVFEERDAEIEAARQEGREPNLPDDSIEWFRNASKGRDYNRVDHQVALQVASIHTTSDLLTQAVLNLCANPDMVEPLREEVVRVLKKHGWQKMALTELRLLDSFFKETQRLKPITLTSVHRLAIADVTLPNGVTIKKGTKTAISSHNMWSPEIYEEPDKFDGYRFLKRRNAPGLEMRSQLVSTSTDHLGFAHGKHACPGRFFAANEVKIAMVHLLLKYDMRISDPSIAQWSSYGVQMFTNPEAKISVRAREPEIDLEELARAL